MHISRKHKLAALRFVEGGDGGGSGAGAGTGGDNGGKPAGGDDGKNGGDKGDRGSGDDGKNDRLPASQEDLDKIIQARLARDRKERMSDDEIAELKRKAERADELERERMSDQEKAVAEAKDAARKEAEEKVRAEYLPNLQEANLRAAAATVLSDDKLDSWLKTVNVSAFVDEQGTVNTDEVMGTLTALFGDSDARGGDRRKNGGHPDWGHSRTNGGGVHSGVEAGRELYKSRYNK